MHVQLVSVTTPTPTGEQQVDLIATCTGTTKCLLSSVVVPTIFVDTQLRKLTSSFSLYSFTYSTTTGSTSGNQNLPYCSLYRTVEVGVLSQVRCPLRKLHVY
jgi:hypothetical protein